MKVYLAKFRLGKRVAFKVGHTKYFHAVKRFEDPQYDVFDDVSIVTDINIQHEDPRVARMAARLVEAVLLAAFPKNFRLEEYFQTECNTFTGLSGITEMFILNESQEEHIVADLFRRVAKNVQKVMESENVV